MQNKLDYHQEPGQPTSHSSSFSLTFFVGMAIYLTFIVVVGFWPTYFGDLFSGKEFAKSGFVEITWKTHIHAFVFMAWMGTLCYQTLLVARNNTKRHTKVGKYGFLWGVLVALLGLFMVSLVIQSGITQGLTTLSKALPGMFLSGGFVAIFEFAILLILGFIYRTSPDEHKRYMLFATIALANAAASRWGILINEWTGPWASEIIHTFMITPIWAYDFYKDKRIHKATLIGTFIIGLYFLKRLL
ncbi:hypothetical protein Asal01_03425 [Fodinibius salicampi]